MSDQTNEVFDTNTAKNDSVPSELSELVGDGKKYATAEDALKSVPHAQSHIAELEKAIGELRDDLAQRDTAQQLLDKVLEKRTSNDVQDTTPVQSTQDIEKLVKTIVNSTKSEEVATSNLQTVENAVKAVHGEHSSTWVSEKANELGIAVDDLQGLAKLSPDAFFKLVGLDTKTGESEKLDTSGTVSTENMNSDVGVKPYTYAWYQKLRRTDPTVYFSAKTQREQMKHAREMGDAFYAQ